MLYTQVTAHHRSRVAGPHPRTGLCHTSNPRTSRGPRTERRAARDLRFMVCAYIYTPRTQASPSGSPSSSPAHARPAGHAHGTPVTVPPRGVVRSSRHGARRLSPPRRVPRPGPPSPNPRRRAPDGSAPPASACEPPGPRSLAHESLRLGLDIIAHDNGGDVVSLLAEELLACGGARVAGFGAQGCRSRGWARWGCRRGGARPACVSPRRGCRAA